MDEELETDLAGHDRVHHQAHDGFVKPQVNVTLMGFDGDAQGAITLGLNYPVGLRQRLVVERWFGGVH